MPVLSLTRLRLRSVIYYPPFLWHTMASIRQLKRSDGFINGLLAQEDLRTYWTMSIWRDELTMRAFRDSFAHKIAMPKLSYWCDEASVTHFEHAGSDLPSGEQAVAHMRASARLSKVRNPSEDHAAGRISRHMRAPSPGLSLKPQT